MKRTWMSWLLVACPGLVITGCGATTPDRIDHSGSPAVMEQHQATAERLTALEAKITDVDERLQRIEAMIRRAAADSAEPDPSAVYSVAIDGLPYLGPEHAKVTVVKAYEFACGYCAKVAPVMRQLLADYSGELKVVYAPYIVHADVAVLPALAVCAAAEQDKFGQMESLVWQKAWTQRDLSDGTIAALAEEAGLDMERYRKDLASPECMDTIRRSVKNLSSVGTRGTPTFYINGRFVMGARSIDVYKAVIDDELAKANQAIQGGVKVEDYYKQTVVQGGQKSL